MAPGSTSQCLQLGEWRVRCASAALVFANAAFHISCQSCQVALSLVPGDWDSPSAHTTNWTAAYCRLLSDSLRSHLNNKHFFLVQRCYTRCYDCQEMITEFPPGEGGLCDTCLSHLNCLVHLLFKFQFGVAGCEVGCEQWRVGLFQKGRANPQRWKPIRMHPCF